jgi:hypothetical protein
MYKSESQVQTPVTVLKLFLFISHISYLFHTFPIYFTLFLFISHFSYLFHTFPIYFTLFIFISHFSYLFHTFPIYFTHSRCGPKFQNRQTLFVIS